MPIGKWDLFKVVFKLPQSLANSLAHLLYNISLNTVPWRYICWLIRQPPTSSKHNYKASYSLITRHPYILFDIFKVHHRPIWSHNLLKMTLTSMLKVELHLLAAEESSQGLGRLVVHFKHNIPQREGKKHASYTV